MSKVSEGRWYPSPPPDDNLYVIYSIGEEERQEWPADLLDYSFRRSQQRGTLIRLVSGDRWREGGQLPLTANGHTLVTPAFFPELKWPVVNKVGSLDFLFRKLDPEFCRRNAEATLLFLDPDMIFTSAWEPSGLVRPGKAFGQRWIGYERAYCEKSSDSIEWCPDSEEDCLMYPFAITFADMERLAPAILEEALASFHKHNDWMVDMTAFVIAMAKDGLEVETAPNFGICNVWESKNDESAPILHYCQAMFDCSGNEIWRKNYTPWKPVPDPALATNRVDREVLSTLSELRSVKKALGRIAFAAAPTNEITREST